MTEELSVKDFVHQVALPLVSGGKLRRSTRVTLLRRWTDRPESVDLESVLSTMEAFEGLESNGSAPAARKEEPLDTNARAIATMERDVGQE